MPPVLETIKRPFGSGGLRLAAAAKWRAPPQGRKLGGDHGGHRPGGRGRQHRRRQPGSNEQEDARAPPTLDAAQSGLCAGSGHLLQANAPPVPLAHPTCHKRAPKPPRAGARTSARSGWWDQEQQPGFQRWQALYVFLCYPAHGMGCHLTLTLQIMLTDQG